MVGFQGVHLLLKLTRMPNRVLCPVDAAKMSQRKLQSRIDPSSLITVYARLAAQHACNLEL